MFPYISPPLVLSYINTYTRQILLNADLCHNNYQGKNSQHVWHSSRRKKLKSKIGDNGGRWGVFRKWKLWPVERAADNVPFHYLPLSLTRHTLLLSHPRLSICITLVGKTPSDWMKFWTLFYLNSHDPTPTLPSPF